MCTMLQTLEDNTVGILEAIGSFIQQIIFNIHFVCYIIQVSHLLEKEKKAQLPNEQSPLVEQGPGSHKKKAKRCLNVSRRWQSQVTDSDRGLLRQMPAHWARTTPAWERGRYRAGRFYPDGSRSVAGLSWW